MVCQSWLPPLSPILPELVDSMGRCLVTIGWLLLAGYLGLGWAVWAQSAGWAGLGWLAWVGWAGLGWLGWLGWPGHQIAWICCALNIKLNIRNSRAEYFI